RNRQIRNSRPASKGAQRFSHFAKAARVGNSTDEYNRDCGCQFLCDERYCATISCNNVKFLFRVGFSDRTQFVVALLCLDVQNKVFSLDVSSLLQSVSETLYRSFTNNVTNSPDGNEWLHLTDCQLLSIEKSMSYRGVRGCVSTMFPFVRQRKIEYRAE